MQLRFLAVGASLAYLALHAVHPASAQDAHSHQMHQHGAAGTQPTETGHAAFAAIQEIVQGLEASPDTDWSQVDIDLLHSHLVDMDNVMMRSTVEREDIPGGAKFRITGDNRAAASINRMLKAQTGMLGQTGEFTYAYEPSPNGATWTVTGSGAAQEQKIRALGFYGLIAGGAHHQAHHLMLAHGRTPH